MSIAIKWGLDSDKQDVISQGFLYFDAVTSYTESLSGTVTEYPIDGGGNITDHFTKDNSRFTFSGVISGVDISYHARSVKDDIGNDSLNSTDTPAAVKVTSKNNPLLKFVPDTIGQFFTPAKPQINTLIQAPETLESIRDTLRQGFKYPSPVQLFIYDRGNFRLQKPIANLVMTSIDFKEDAESGDALWCDITLVQVTFADSLKTQIPKGIQSALVSADMADRAAETANKGTQDSTEHDADQASTLQRFKRSGISSIEDIARKYQGSQ